MCNKHSSILIINFLILKRCIIWTNFFISEYKYDISPSHVAIIYIWMEMTCNVTVSSVKNWSYSKRKRKIESQIEHKRIIKKLIHWHNYGVNYTLLTYLWYLFMVQLACQIITGWTKYNFLCEKTTIMTITWQKKK